MRCEAQSAALARQLVAKSLADWGAITATDTAELIVTELVANAVRHTGCRCIAVSVRIESRTVRVAVRDSSVTLPVFVNTGTTETSGRGIALVHALSTRWGVEEAYLGKWVWAEIAQ
ncbi:ATP-binding protein [Kitasatospora sp. NPDC057223]|jgi:anti-sigma regulatory factor (Ser/Thr protein kinase)|uniref:ATP-binding protein n=1 Tax=Kitasatospora sp. NPDC057223 TaxID=3346055 RepID=UPI00362F4D4A